MKGQLVFEFVIALVMFFVIVVYMINYLNLTVASYSQDSYANSMESAALQISEMLMGEGYTEGGERKIIGLSSGWPELDTEKVAWFFSDCQDYGAMAEEFGLSEDVASGVPGPRDFRIELDMDGSVVELGGEPMACGRDVPDKRNVLMRRVALLEGSPVELMVWVW